MKTWQFVVLIATILVAAYINGGVYQIVAAAVPPGETQPGSVKAYKINRLTGQTWYVYDNKQMEVGK